jgi:hypothetical protein
VKQFLEHHNYMVDRWKPRWWFSLRERFAPTAALRISFPQTPIVSANEVIGKVEL